MQGRTQREPSWRDPVQVFAMDGFTGFHSSEHLLAVETELNNRPRLVLDNRTPAEAFSALLTSEKQSVLRR